MWTDFFTDTFYLYPVKFAGRADGANAPPAVRARNMIIGHATVKRHAP